jgi:phage baseplate assembly protein W
MAGISPKLPLTVDKKHGHYSLNENYKDAVRQNLKNLILTAPGERIMDPDFGVGIRNFLFENNNTELYADIESAIMEQVQKYMSFIEIVNIGFNRTSALPINEENGLSITLTFYIIPLQFYDNLEITTPIY